MTTGKVGGGGPERVVRRGNEYFIAVVEQRLHGHHDQLRDAVADEDIFDTYAGNLFALALLHNRFTGRVEAFGVAVALGRGQVAHHILENLFRRLKTKGRRVANV